MYNLFLLANPGNALHPLLEEMDRVGLSCQVGEDLPLDEEAATRQLPQGGPPGPCILQPGPGPRRFVDQCKELKLPVLAVMLRETVDSDDPLLNPDELILSPPQRGELVARVKQAIYRVSGPSGQRVLRMGDLIIDLDRYDVTMAGRRLSLTYGEFQLLVLLASNPGRVFTREALLSQVWDYDYLGGTRTVDVHVRRLRSKIEDPDHAFVETIWNVGYRFKSSG